MKRSLDILGQKWKVRMIKHPEVNGEACFGLCDPDEKTIYIKTGMTAIHTSRVFWHEYLHARLHESGVTLNVGGISPLAEEVICDTMANLLAYELDANWKRKKR